MGVDAAAAVGAADAASFAAVPLPSPAVLVEEASRAYAEAQALLNAEAAKFSGIRTERATTEAGPNTGKTYVYISKYLVALFALATFVFGLLLGWSVCKCIDTCRTPDSYA